MATRRDRLAAAGGILAYFTRHATAANIVLVIFIAAGLYVLHREALRHHRPSHALPGAREAAAEEEAGE